MDLLEEVKSVFSVMHAFYKQRFYWQGWTEINKKIGKS